MFLNKLFGNKNTSNVEKQSTEVTKNVGYYARKVAMLLGLGAAVSGPALPQEQNTQSQTQTKPIVVVNHQEEKKPVLETPVEKESNQKPAMKLAKAISGDSVTSFLQRGFGVSQGWELLVEKDSGKRVLNPRTDLIAGKEYILATNEKQAQNLSSIFQKKEEKNKKVPTSAKKDYSRLSSKKPTIHYYIPTQEFDFSSFFQAIGGVESGGRYNADNSNVGKKLGVNPSKHAKGKHQFTNETLAVFGYDTPEKIKIFLQNPELQEKAMYKLTKMNYEGAMKSPAISQLLQSGVHVVQVLASAHHRGIGGTEWVAKYAIKQENPVQAFFERLEQVKGDWLGTKTSKYVEAVSLRYSQIANVSLEPLKNIPSKTPQPEHETFITQSPEKTPGKEVSTIASNDDVFEETIVVTQKFEQNEIKETKLPETVEFQEVASGKSAIEVIKEKYKNQVLSNIMSDKSIAPAVKQSLVNKLSKVEDMEAWFQEQIEHYNSILKISKNDVEKQHARKILPGLYRLLHNSQTITASANDEYTKIKKAA